MATSGLGLRWRSGNKLRVSEKGLDAQGIESFFGDSGASMRCRFICQPVDLGVPDTDQDHRHPRLKSFLVICDKVRIDIFVCGRVFPVGVIK